MSIASNSRSFMEVLASAVPIVLMISAIGGMALTPLYIMATNNSEAIRELKIDLRAHEQLPSHPVMQTRLNSEVQRLDDRISANDKITAECDRAVAALNAQFEAEKSSNLSKFTEVETQMDASAQSLNIQFAESQRKGAEFQNALHDLGASLPAAPSEPWYFPNISNRALPKPNR